MPGGDITDWGGNPDDGGAMASAPRQDSSRRPAIPADNEKGKPEKPKPTDDQPQATEVANPTAPGDGSPPVA